MKKQIAVFLFFLLSASFFLQIGCSRTEFKGRESTASEQNIKGPKPSGAEADTSAAAMERYNFEKDKTEGRVESSHADTLEVIEPIDTTSQAVEEFDNEKVSSGYSVGYRIQVFATRNLARAKEMAGNIEKNLGLNAYVEYEGELYKVRLGDFSDRDEALKWKEKLKSSFPDCWIVQTTIEK